MSDIQDQAADRVAKAAAINVEVVKRLHQNDVQAGVKVAKSNKVSRAKANG